MEFLVSTLLFVILGLGTITGLLLIILVLGIVAIGLAEYIYKDQLMYIQGVKSNLVYFNNLRKLHKMGIDVSDPEKTEEIISLYEESGKLKSGDE